jgi:signal transduction histidine kinase
MDLCYDERMQKYEVEPGVLSILRLFTGSRAVMTTVQILHFSFFKGSLQELSGTWFFLTAILVDTYLLLPYLFIPWVPKQLKEFFIPAALAVITTGAMIEGYWISQQVGPFAILSESFIILFIPLVLIAWLYRFRLVLFFALGTGMVEFLIFLPGLSDSITSYARVGALAVRTITFLLVGYMVNRLVKAKEMQQQELRKSNQELARANMKLVQNASMIEQLSTSRERNRLARELHDTLAHTLSGLAVQLDAIPSVWDSNPQKANRMLIEALTVTRSGLNETRRALQDLRATPIEEMGLSLAVRTLAEDASGRSSLKLLLDIPEQICNLPPDVEQSLYRIVQEAIQNTVKHASASQLSVMLKQVNSSIKIEISDNGCGFDPGMQTTSSQFGLTGMRERAELMGAQFEIQSRPGSGTTLRVVLEQAHDKSIDL